ncbi:aldehyde dehydrogenase (NAD+) [Panacagrimonas perspica]|uniref:Aldehyde dehydrogenase (NAD+) n=1 Tax=Panacagrimonas perspica TaxID=381431 RepID=A0A4R7PEA6_9GAMM|nr:aldehyde dehydrogenase [Panacagrimonas perspica]TDU31901.1 aldehyde dehydrogenase (NAD+) [Panacagrimonas perspica]THD04223.1 carnitine dehydratase [Panacagrimonas perspica]
MKTYNQFINGRYVEPASGRWLDSIDPYRGQAWARIPQGCAKDVDAAAAAANAAMKSGPWATMTATQRGKLMFKLADLIALNSDRLAEIEVRDNGKLLAEMRGQVAYLPEWWRYFGGLADKIEGAVMPLDKPDMMGFTRHEPVGVVAALTAWNSPLLFVAWKCAAAIAAGCAVIVKPSEFASVSTLEFAALTKEAGFPDGVFNVVTGLGQEAGSALVDHPGVAKVTFTGSDVTGAKIYAQAARSMKRVSLELGGKSPNIVFDDCDLDKAASGVISGIFAATGQTCIAGSRLLVQNSIREAFTEKVAALGRSARKGNPMDADTNIGPVTTAAQYKKVLDYIDIAKAEGARCILGGGPATGPTLTGGQFVEPTIFVDVKPDMRIAREEVFGPVLSIIGFEDEADAIRIGNDTIYGLAAGVWTRDMGRALRVSAAIKAGTVWVNTYRAVSYMMPFGGMKHSGIGRESGLESIRQFLETKSVWLSYADNAPLNPFVLR